MPPSGRAPSPSAAVSPGTSACARGQRGRKRHPCGGASKIGRQAADRLQLLLDPLAHRRDRLAAGPSCTGAAGSRRACSTGPASTILPAYITITRLQTSATTPRSCVIRMIAVPKSLVQSDHQVEDLRLDRHVERGRRLVGDQHLGIAGQRDRDHHALAHAAGELMRIGVDPVLGGRNARPA